MLQFLLDENTDPAIAAGLRRREPAVAALRVGDPGVPPLGTLDPEILRWCETRGYILVTNNRHSMPGHLRDHLREGGHVPGIFVIATSMGIGVIVALLELASQLVDPEECRDQIKHLLSV